MNASATISPEQDQAAAPQHLQALQRANEVRLARAELKRRIGSGEVTVGQVVLSTPWEAASMSVADLLMSQRRWGRTRCRKFLSVIPLTETKTVGSLTERQRHAVATALPATEAERTHLVTAA
ncbi:MAG: hypothetical protein JHC95_08740 [Solirubrobacteraceae bacterium]|nr:hypothetical protein [Solirubrobacteraceae bacterium]